MTGADRETLGIVVRAAWVEWAAEQPAPKPSWICSWQELSESDKEADRRIGEAVVRYLFDRLNTRRLELIEKQAHGLKGGSGPNSAETEEWFGLQHATFILLKMLHPGPSLTDADLEAIETRLRAATVNTPTPPLTCPRRRLL